MKFKKAKKHKNDKKRTSKNKVEVGQEFEDGEKNLKVKNVKNNYGVYVISYSRSDRIEV